MQLGNPLSVMADAMRYSGDLDGALQTVREARRNLETVTFAKPTDRMFALAAVLAFGLGGPVGMLSARLGGNRVLAIVLVYMLFGIVIVGGMVVLAGPFVRQASDLANALRPKGVHARVVLSDTPRSPGGRLTLTAASCTDGKTLRGKTVFGARLRVPLARLVALEM